MVSDGGTFFIHDEYFPVRLGRAAEEGRQRGERDGSYIRRRPRLHFPQTNWEFRLFFVKHRVRAVWEMTLML